MDEQSKNSFDEVMEELEPLFSKVFGEKTMNAEMRRPRHYHRDGTPYLDTPEKPAFMQWAEDMTRVTRHVANTKTMYGERLSTIFLGLDSFGEGPPILFETMLFAPGDNQRFTWGKIVTEAEKRIAEANEKYIAKHYPHNELQLRYRTEREAGDMHETLKLHCLIPPRWRHFLLATVGGWWMWKHYYEDEDDDV
jgi:hypothetical protein